MEMRHAKRLGQVCGCLLPALYMLLAWRLDVSPTDIADQVSLAQAIRAALSGSVWSMGLVFAALAAMVSLAVQSVRQRGRRLWFACLPAAFMTVCVSLGRAFIDPDWGHLVISPKMIRLQKWLFCLPGWFLIALCAVLVLYAGMDRLSAGKCSAAGKSGIVRAFEAHPFLAPMAVLLVCYVPVLIVSMPGIVVSGDTISQIVQYYGGEPRGHTIIYPDSIWNNHHPVLHTLLLDLFLEMGRVVFHSASVGLGLMIGLQVLSTILVLALALAQMREEGVPAQMCLLLALFLGLHPRIQNLMVMSSKDMLYANALVLWGITQVRLLKGRPHTGKYLLIACLSMMLMRNEGVYILLGSLAVMFVMIGRRRKLAAVTMAAIMAFWLVWNNVVFPALHISPGSRREMLSIPFQQTARYAANFPDAVTQEEREAIERVLPYDVIIQYYNPDSADGVKMWFRDEAAGEDLAAYFKTWLKMFAKRPMTYIEAVLENKNMYLYTTGSRIDLENTVYRYAASELDFQVITEDCEMYGVTLAYPAALEKARNAYEQIREAIFALPGLRLITQNATYVWVIVILLCYVLYRGGSGALQLMVPLALQLMVVFVGPLDAIGFRYMYPLAMYLPIPLMYILYQEEKRAVSR